jgi:hypothetical protein
MAIHFNDVSAQTLNPQAIMRKSEVSDILFDAIIKDSVDEEKEL